MADEGDKMPVKDSGAVYYVETVNGYPGPNITLLASDLKAYTTAQADAKFTVPIASATVAGKVRVGAGLTIDANGVLGTQASAPDWSNITNKPTEFPPNKAGTTVVGGIKVGAGLSIQSDGTLNATGTAPDWSQITNKPAAYPPTIAGPNTIGGVKQGSGIFIDPVTGTINSATSIPTWDAIVDKPSTFPPPVASDKVLGGVKEGVDIEISADGAISASVRWDNILLKPTEYPTPVASRTVRGGVYVGDGLQDDGNGVLSLRLAQPNDIGGVIPGDTLTTDAVTGRLDVVKASKENAGIVIPGDTLYIDDNGYLEANPGAIQPATADTLGGIKVGSGLHITEDGVLSNGARYFENSLFEQNNFADPITGSWTMPDGIDYFRVTLVGPGGCGGDSGGNANNFVGGGGGGGGAYVCAVFRAAHFPKGQEFEFTVGGNAGIWPNQSGACSFKRKGDKQSIIAAEGGQGGLDGKSTGAVSNGFANGGRGGSPNVSGTEAGMLVSVLIGAGQNGSPGFRVTSIDGKTFKTIGGQGGPSVLGGNLVGVLSGFGGGTEGGGDSSVRQGGSAGGRSMVMIEW